MHSFIHGLITPTTRSPDTFTAQERWHPGRKDRYLLVSSFGENLVRVTVQCRPKASSSSSSCSLRSSGDRVGRTDDMGDLAGHHLRTGRERAAHQVPDGSN